MPKPNVVTQHAFLRRWCSAAAAAALLFSALAASASTAPNCDPDNSTCTAEDVEETALLAHSRAARLAKEESGALSLAPRASGGKRGCQDDPQGWKDSEGHNCKKYVSDKWCTAKGGYGNGWWSWWGSFSGWSVDGIDASMACCGCGGGTAAAPATACHAVEADGQPSYGLDFYFQTDSKSGCSAAACQPASALAFGISKIFTAEAAGDSCGCWAATSGKSGDGSARQPEAGERMFLFSYKSSASAGVCTDQTCWARYAEVLNVFKLGSVISSEASSTQRSSQEANTQLLKLSHWTTQCEHMPEGSRHNHADGMMPVLTLVNMLMSWHAVAVAENVQALVSIHDSDFDQAASTVVSVEELAIDALARCSSPEWTPNERAACICSHANDIANPSQRAQRCAKLSPVALDVGSPWECAVNKVRGIKVCSAYAPWWNQFTQTLTESWNAFKRWGLSLVPTSRCYPTNPQPCSQFALKTKSAQCSEVSADTLTNDWLDMPKQLQGVFWLTHQGDSTALVSFGRTSDGAGISQGKIGKDGVYKVRVPGDRSWSFATTDGGTWALTEAIDLVYEFHFDNAEDPSSAQIIPVARTVLGASVPPWLLNFNMTLVPEGDARFPGSIVWQRESDFFNFITVDAGTYQVVQVIDGDGKRLPAYELFERFCKNPSKSGTSSPGSIWYHAYETQPFTVTTVTEELDKCPSLVGYIAPQTVTGAFVLSKKFGWLDLHEFINDPPFDPTVYNEFSYLNSLAVIHGALITYGGANKLAVDRICPPNVTEPLNKFMEFGSLSALEDTDSLEGSCGDKPFSKLTPAVMCSFLVLTQLPMSDRMGNNSGNTWEHAMRNSPSGATKEDYLMSFFDPYKNQDGDPIYPAEEFDWRATFWKQPGHWDNALDVSYALDVFGTFRVRQVVGERPSHGGESAALVLKLDSLSGFKRRKGFAAWGGNMYFTAEGNLLGIERNTLGGGSPEWVWADAPAAEWEYAKWVFRSTLMNAVTVIDHLWFTHLSVANPLAMSCRETLLPQHPLRRLLNAASFGTIKVNAEATHLLIGEKQVLHRASPFVDWGEVHNAAEDSIMTFENYFGPFLNTAVIDDFHPRIKTAPLYADGPLLMTAISDMLEGYFGAMGADWCEAGSDRIMDQGIQDLANWFEAWYRSERQDRAVLNLRWFKGDEKADWTCGAVKKLLKCHIFGVSGWHQHVGKVADYVRNPEFIGISWAPGEMAPRPQQAMLYALVSAATGFIGVTLDQNFEFVVEGIENAEALKQVLRKFQSDLKAIEPIIEKRNLARTVPYNRMNPAYAEISLYQ